MRTSIAVASACAGSSSRRVEHRVAALQVGAHVRQPEALEQRAQVGHRQLGAADVHRSEEGDEVTCLRIDTSRGGTGHAERAWRRAEDDADA